MSLKMIALLYLERVTCYEAVNNVRFSHFYHRNFF